MKYIKVYDNRIFIKGKSQSQWYKRHIEKELHEYFAKEFGITCKVFLDYDGDYGITIRSSSYETLKGHFLFEYRKTGNSSLDDWNEYIMNGFSIDGWFIDRLAINLFSLSKFKNNSSL